jgi:hypothetical protein
VRLVGPGTDRKPRRDSSPPGLEGTRVDAVEVSTVACEKIEAGRGAAEHVGDQAAVDGGQRRPYAAAQAAVVVQEDSQRHPLIGCVNEEVGGQERRSGLEPDPVLAAPADPPSGHRGRRSSPGQLGVTKGGFYGYFADRTRDQVLARAVDLLLDRPGATTVADPAPRPGTQDEELAG